MTAFGCTVPVGELTDADRLGATSERTAERGGARALSPATPSRGPPATPTRPDSAPAGRSRVRETYPITDR